MWIFRYTYCLFKGHAYVDVINIPRHPYKYCLRCGKVKEAGHGSFSASWQ